MSEVTPSKPKKQSRKGLFFYGLFTKYVFCFRCHTDPKAKPSGEWDSGAFQLSFRPPAHICCLRATRAPAVMSKMQSSARAKGEVAKVETSRARSSGGEAEVEKSLPYDSFCLGLVVVRFLADRQFVESRASVISSEVEKSLPCDSFCLGLVVVRFLADEQFVESRACSARNDKSSPVGYFAPWALVSPLDYNRSLGRTK